MTKRGRAILKRLGFIAALFVFLALLALQAASLEQAHCRLGGTRARISRYFGDHVERLKREHGVTSIYLHSDNGNAMVVSTMLDTLHSLGIVLSTSRPGVLDYNAFIQSLAHVGLRPLI